jgi:hypothetical protein
VCALPNDYPLAEAKVVCRCDLSRSFMAELNGLVATHCSAHKGERCLMDLVALLQDKLPAMVKAELAADDQKRLKVATPKSVGELPAFLREFIWFHHIYRLVLRARVARLAGICIDLCLRLQQDEAQDDL